MMRNLFKYLAVPCLAAAFVSCLALSCKKEEKTDTKKYLSGYLTVAGGRSFVKLDEDLTFTVSGTYHPEGKALGMYYSIGGITSGSDTVMFARPDASQSGPLPADYRQKITYNFRKGNPKTQVRDTLGTFTFTFSVYPEDSDKYYVSSATYSVTTVDDMRSIPELPSSDIPDLHDSEGNPYFTVVAGGNRWMSRNLADSNKGGVPFRGCNAMSFLTGRFYTWNEAVKACPDGYRLPTGAEWDAVTTSAEGIADVGSIMLDATFNGVKMWEFWPQVRITNSTGISVLPMGYANVADMSFSGIKEYASFWTADTKGDQAVYRYIYQKENILHTGYADKTSMAMPVRCVIK